MKEPKRPALPLLLVPLALAWAGVLAANELNYQGVSVNQALPFALALGSGLILGWKIVEKQMLLQPLLCALVFLLAFGTGNLYYAELAKNRTLSEGLVGQQELVIIEDTRHYPDSSSSEALVELSQGKTVRVRVFWKDTSLQLAKGSIVTAYTSVTPLKENQRWLFDKGIIGTLSLSEIEQEEFSQDVWGAIDSFRAANVETIQQLGGNGAALLMGILLGYREALQDTLVEQDFISCGLTHLIAVSGSHLAVVAALLSWFLKRLPLGTRSEIGILLLVLALYVMLTGLQPSAIRSALMAGIAGCSVFVGRRGHAPSALAAAAVAMILVYPPNAYSLGFWLSVFAVFGISLFSNLVAWWVSTAGPFPSKQAPGALASGLALTLVATAATLPIAVPTFAVLSLIGPLANLLAAPLVSLVLVVGMPALLIAALVPPLGAFMLQLAAWLCELTALIAEQLARLPWASLPLDLSIGAALAVCLALAALLFKCWPLPQAKFLRRSFVVAVLGVCLLVAVLPLGNAPRLVVMDIGQGDAILVQEQNHTVLIDTGASDNALVHALARNRITKLDAVIITHLDSDHAGALGRLRGLVPVDRVYFARGILEHQAEDSALREALSVVTSGELNELTYGATLQLGKTMSLRMVWPTETAVEGSNQESICLQLQYDKDADGLMEYEALLTGDAESPELEGILAAMPELTADIIKVGHHGSRDAVTPELLSRLGSKLALISVGANNWYGHPSKEVIDLLDESGVRVFRTDYHGDITCTFRGSSLELSYATMANELH